MSDFQTPLIFDESFDGSILEERHFGEHGEAGLVGKSGSFLSMSAYEKSHPVDMIDYRTTGALHDSSPFGTYAQPHYAPHLLFPPDLTGTTQDTDFHFAAAADFSHTQAFAGHRPSSFDLRLRDAPEITHATQHGSQGTVVEIQLQTKHDFFAPPSITFSLVFAAEQVQAAVQILPDIPGSLRRYVVSGHVPPFIRTGWHSFQVPLSLLMSSMDGSSQQQEVKLPTFVYTSPQPSSSNQSRKRKASNGSDYDSAPPSKKVANPTLRIQEQGTEAYDYNQTSPYSPYVPTPTGSGVNTGYTRTASPRPSGHQHSTSSASQASLTAPSPHTPAWSPSFTTVKTEQSPHPPLTPIPRPASAASALKTVPRLVRTSTIQQSPPGLSSSVHAPMHSQSFNPYAMFPTNKAILKLNGDLDALSKEWTTEEIDARRRLVEFSRSQTGTTVNASFKAVAPEDRSPQNITISCIFWKEKNECFVTSVDTIYLLESLIGVRFTVEEKNRIRRNLEGFRPLTVSKSKADSEDFFKCIMGFPNPKPRNIEKDVKVFPWKILAGALKKIISKYSASHASTASAILTPAPSAYASTEVSSDYLTGSPRADYVTSSMSAYPITTTAGYSPAVMSSRMASSISSASMPDLRLQMPVVEGTYNIQPNYGFQPMPQLPMSSAQTPHSMSAPASVRMQHQWDFASFVNDSPASMAPASASTAGYTRSIETADFSTPASYSMSKQ